MSQLYFNILFYLLGLILASIPFLAVKKKGKNEKSSLWYKISVTSIFILLAILGTIKTINDNTDQHDMTNDLTSLKKGITDLKSSLTSEKAKYNDLIENLKKAGVNVKDNKPIIKNFNNNIDKVNTLNQY